LRLLVHRPEEIGDHLVAALFDDPLNRAALDALCDGENLHSAMAASDGVVADLLGRLAVQDASDDEPRGIMSRLLFLAAERAAVALEAEARLSGDLATYQPSISYLRTQIIVLREVPADLATVEPLLRWLVDYSEGSVDA
jgi:hypothetical protein